MRKKALLVFSMIGMMAIGVQAQNLDVAKKMYYYERYKTAQAEFEKVVAGSPGNVDAYYWLTLTKLMQGDRAGARTTAQAGLTATNSNPMMLVAMGHVELSEGKKQDARSRFETAISLADKKTLAGILNAVGRAHGSVSIANSDPDYGIEKLKLAAQKEPKSSDVYMNLGDNYRRKLDGGNAILSYEQALALEPGNARAPYKCGLVYKTQDNCEALKRYFTRATTIDPNFMPAWRELYESYAKRESNCFNLAEAKTYFDKYMQTTDQGYQTDLLKMSFCYYSKDFNCAITEANNIGSKYGKEAEIEILKWKAFIYNQMNDSLNAKTSLEQYFVKETNPDNIDISLYRLMAYLYGKFPGEEKKGVTYYEKAISLEPVKANHVRDMLGAAALCEKAKDTLCHAQWLKKVVETKENPSAYDIFMAGIAFYNASDYNQSAELFKTYTVKFPADWRGPYWTGRNYVFIDSNMAQGLAVPYYEKFIPMGEPDPQAKRSVIDASRYLFFYNIQIVKDKALATNWLNKIKSLDSTNAMIPELEGYLGIKPAKATTPTRTGGGPSAGEPAANNTGTGTGTTPAGTKPAATPTTKPAKPAATKPAPATKPAAKVVKKTAGKAVVKN